MDYFCYISRTKVDQLYQNLGPAIVEEWIEKQTTENDVGLQAHADWNIAKIVSLFKAGITYGRKGVIQREQKLKLHYVEKLRKVLVALTKERPILSFERALRDGILTGLYYHVGDTFAVQTPLEHNTPAETVISLSADTGGRKLILDCSLRFFSEGNQPDGIFQVTSSNSRFFTKALPLHLESVFVLLSQSSTEIVGSPLYLKLSPNSPAVL